MKKINKYLTKIITVTMLCCIVLINMFPLITYARDREIRYGEDFSEFFEYYSQAYNRSSNSNTSNTVYYKDGNFYVSTAIYSDRGYEREEVSDPISVEDAFKMYVYDKTLIGPNVTYQIVTDDRLDGVLSSIKHDSSVPLFEALQQTDNQKKIKEKIESLNKKYEEDIKEANSQAMTDIFDYQITSDVLELTPEEIQYLTMLSETEEVNAQNSGWFENIIGAIATPIFSGLADLFTSFCDEIIIFMQKTIMPGTYQAVDRVGANEYMLKRYEQYVGIEAVALFAKAKANIKVASTDIDDVEIMQKSRTSVPFIYLGTAAILTNNVPAFDINFFKNGDEIKNPILNGVDLNKYAANAYKIYQSQSELTQTIPTNESYEKYQEVYNAGKDADKTNAVSIMRPLISKWFVTLRNFVVLCLLVELAYVAIRIIISSTTDKAKYKHMLVGWFKAVFILFSIVFFMVIAVNFTDSITNSFSNTYDPQTGDYLMNFIRTKIAVQSVTKNYSMQFGLTLMYLVTIYFTLYYCFIYFKRMFYMAILTILSPVVTLTFPIDTVGDGKAQAFGKWLREYLYQLVMQPLQLIVYVVFVSTSIEILLNGGSGALIVAVIGLTFVSKAEKLLRELFHAATMINNEDAKAFGQTANKMFKGSQELGLLLFGGLGSEKSSGKQMLDYRQKQVKVAQAQLQALKSNPGNGGTVPGSGQTPMAVSAGTQQKQGKTRTAVPIILNAFEPTIKGLKRPRFVNGKSQRFFKTSTKDTNSENYEMSFEKGKTDSKKKLTNDEKQKLLKQGLEQDLKDGKLKPDDFADLEDLEEDLSFDQKLAKMFGQTYRLNDSVFKVYGNKLYLQDVKSQKDMKDIYKHVYGDTNWVKKYLKDQYGLDEKTSVDIEKLFNKDPSLGIDYVANVYTLSRLNVDNLSASNFSEKHLDELNDILSAAVLYDDSIDKKLELIDKKLEELEKQEREGQVLDSKLLEEASDVQDDVYANSLNKEFKDAIEELQQHSENISNENKLNLKQTVKHQKEEIELHKFRKKPVLEKLQALNWGDTKLEKVRIKVKQRGKRGTVTYDLNLPPEIAKQMKKLYKRSKNIGAMKQKVNNQSLNSMINTQKESTSTKPLGNTARAKLNKEQSNKALPEHTLDSNTTKENKKVEKQVEKSVGKPERKTEKKTQRRFNSPSLGVEQNINPSLDDLGLGNENLNNEENI